MYQWTYCGFCANPTEVYRESKTSGRSSKVLNCGAATATRRRCSMKSYCPPLERLSYFQWLSECVTLNQTPTAVILGSSPTPLVEWGILKSSANILNPG